MKKYVLNIVVIWAVISSAAAFAGEVPTMPAFTKDDRVLILSAHPDDETIGAGGVIQKAVKAGAKVKIAYFTNGDHNELAFIVYEKRLTMRRGEFLHMGEVRRKEALSAMASLGLGQDNFIFLGYPDFGTMEILTKYWGATKPFKDFLTRIPRVSYPEAMSPGAPYTGESILKDMKTVLADFKPTKIFVSHPADTNQDHQSLYLFLHIALWDLEGTIGRPEVFPYLIHVVGWPSPRGYRPDLALEGPAHLNAIAWRRLPLTDKEVRSKYDAISFYKSEIVWSSSYLYTFARRNELFGDYPVLTMKKQTSEKIEWADADVGVLGNKTEEAFLKEEKLAHLVSDLAYARQDDNFCVKITLKRAIDKNFGIAFTLIGYSKTKPFADMPKIRASVGALKLSIKDKKKNIPLQGSRLISEGKTIILKVPLAVLGNPDRIMSRVRVRTGDLPLDDTAWRIIELK